jgi:hypothetical protein
MEDAIQTKNYFGLQIDYPSLLVNFDKTCTVWSTCAVTATRFVSFTSLQWTARYRRKTTSACKWSAFRYWLISTTFAVLVAHAWWVLSVTFQLHNWDAKHDTDEKLLRPPNKVTFVIDQFRPNLYLRIAYAVTIRRGVSGTSVQWKARCGRKRTSSSK